MTAARGRKYRKKTTMGRPEEGVDAIASSWILDFDCPKNIGAIWNMHLPPSPTTLSRNATWFETHHPEHFLQEGEQSDEALPSTAVATASSPPTKTATAANIVTTTFNTNNMATATSSGSGITMAMAVAPLSLLQEPSCYKQAADAYNRAIDDKENGGVVGEVGGARGVEARSRKERPGGVGGGGGREELDGGGEGRAVKRRRGAGALAPTSSSVARAESKLPNSSQGLMAQRLQEFKKKKAGSVGSTGATHASKASSSSARPRPLSGGGEDTAISNRTVTRRPGVTRRALRVDYPHPLADNASVACVKPASSRSARAVGTSTGSATAVPISSRTVSRTVSKPVTTVKRSIGGRAAAPVNGDKGAGARSNRAVTARGVGASTTAERTGNKMSVAGGGRAANKRRPAGPVGSCSDALSFDEELKARLDAHNKVVCKGKHTYEPAASVKDCRMWERRTGKKYGSLTWDERADANKEIDDMRAAIKAAS